MNQKRIKNLFKSEYLGNISIQVFGTGIAQVIPLLLMPILSRIYDKEAFAVYASFMAVIAVLSVATGARYQYAIVLPKDKIDAVNVFKASVFYNILYTLIITVLALIYYFVFSDFLNLKNNEIVPNVISIKFKSDLNSKTTLFINNEKISEKFLGTSGTSPENSLAFYQYDGLKLKKEKKIFIRRLPHRFQSL